MKKLFILIGSALMLSLTSTAQLKVVPGGSVGIGTSTPDNNYFLTIPTNGTIKNGISMTLSGATSTAYGINLGTANSKYSGILYSNSSASAGIFYGMGAKLTAGTTAEAYIGYRSSTPKTYSIYALGGDYTAFLKGKTVITSSSSPNSTADLEVQNTTSGSGNPATVSLRQTTSLTSNGSVLANLNFGDNYSTNPQARIQVLRDATSSSSSDLPTAISFATIADGSASLTEKMRINGQGIAIDTLPRTDFKFTVNGGTKRGILCEVNQSWDWGNSIAAIVSNINTMSYLVQYNDTDRFYVNGLGEIYSYGEWITSDKHKKKNINPITNSIDKVKQLKGVSFQYQNNTSSVNLLETNPQLGLIAQDVEAIVPEAVRTTHDGTKVLSYNSIIALLVEALKEQQTQIETMQEDLSSCCKKNSNKSLEINDNNNSGSTRAFNGFEMQATNRSYLLQNKPNPFSNETVIEYFLSDDATNASIMIFDLNGKLLKANNIKGSGSGSISIYGSEFKPGMYLYSLVINGKEEDTRKMILSK